jgi:hypothetical protein
MGERVRLGVIKRRKRPQLHRKGGRGMSGLQLYAARLAQQSPARIVKDPFRHRAAPLKL